MRADNTPPIPPWFLPFSSHGLKPCLLMLSMVCILWFIRILFCAKVRLSVPGIYGAPVLCLSLGRPRGPGRTQSSRSGSGGERGANRGPPDNGAPRKVSAMCPLHTWEPLATHGLATQGPPRPGIGGGLEPEARSAGLREMRGCASWWGHGVEAWDGQQRWSRSGGPC